MANSKYYHKLYKNYRTEYDNCKSDLNEINTILNNVSNNLSDEIRDVNTEIADLKEDLQKAVRYCSSFDNNMCGLKTESQTESDTRLSGVIRELEEEITRLQNKQTQAGANKDYYYQKYKDKKEEEQAEFWNSLWGGK